MSRIGKSIPGFGKKTNRFRSKPNYKSSLFFRYSVPRESLLPHEVSSEEADDDAEWIDMKRILRIVPRDNPNDPFKPHSLQAVHNLSTTGTELTPEEETLLQNVAADIDTATPFDRTDPPGVRAGEISRESRYYLRKLPAWLRTFLETKFERLHEKYGALTHRFLEMLGSRLDYRKMKGWDLLPRTEVEAQINDELYEELRGMKGDEEYIVMKDEDGDDDDSVDRVLVTKEDNDPEYWTPMMMHRASDALKAILVAGASDSDGESPGEGEWEDDTTNLQQMRNKRKGLTMKTSEDTYKGAHWEDIVAEDFHFKEKAKWEVGLEFTPAKYKKQYYLNTCHPKKKEGKDVGEVDKKKSGGSSGINKSSSPDLPHPPSSPPPTGGGGGGRKRRQSVAEKFVKKSLHRLRQSRRILKEFGTEEDFEEFERFKEEAKKEYYSTHSGHPLYKPPDNVVNKKAQLFKDRGVGKSRSRIYFKDPCKGPVTEVTRELRQVRPTEGFHAYINYITTSAPFKLVIMSVIIFNSVLLALETEENEEFQRIFEFLDMMCLSIYVVEFLLKCYADPVMYFQNGFNRFDFIILMIAILKAIVDWTHDGNIWWLRYLAMVRALRILRCVSLSVHTQVLVTALVETLRHHVLSVLILLGLLMYVTAIVMYYFYGDPDDITTIELKDTWGNILNAMLRLFAFVTMDGWTELLESFYDASRGPEDSQKTKHLGRLFCLICTVLGNFLFSNIFIAIIIMQITEATDDFRKRQTDQKLTSVFLKQHAVFRRLKLDMRLLLSRQKVGVTDDFYELGSKFVRRLKHDDLVDAKSIVFSPLWMDCFYKGMQRAHHTSNILMTLHRKLSDRLVKLNNLYEEGRYTTRGISRARYNRYLDIKARLTLLKESLLETRGEPKKPKLRVKLPNIVETQEHAKPPEHTPWKIHKKKDGS